MAICRSFLKYGLIFVLFSFSALPVAGEVDLKPGDTIGPENWEKVKGMVGENLLNRIKQGYTFKIKEVDQFEFHQRIFSGDGQYSGQARLGSNGELLNYVAGLPFPHVDPHDPQART